MRHRPFRTLAALILCLIVLSPTEAVPVDPPPQTLPAPFVRWEPAQRLPRPLAGATGEGGELRAFWVDAFHDGIKTPAQINQLVADAHAANANALFVQVRRRGDSYYNESVEPRAKDDDLAPPPFDPLAGLIAAAHGADPPLQVHAWVVVFPVWTPTYTTTDTTRHVYFLHGRNRAWDDPDNWLTHRYNGTADPTPDFQLDPGHPDAARYTVDVFLYLVRHYDIDGLHLDYIRYYGQDYGYNKVSEDRFHAAYGGSGHPSPTDPDWMAWRREQVTGVVRRIYLEALALKPDLIVSAATIAWGDGPAQTGGWQTTSAYCRVFQDWRGWLEEGILDLAVPMNYDREHKEDQRAWFEHWIEWEKDHQFGRGVVAGQGAWINYISGTLTQTHKVQLPSPAGHRAMGISFYSYASTNADPDLANSTFYAALSHPSPYGDPPFPTWVAPPTLPWKASPATGHLMGWAINSSGPLDRAAVTLSGPEHRTLRTDGNGFFGAVDLVPGDYTVTLPAPASSALHATVTAGRVAIATVNPPSSEPALRALLVDAFHDGFKNPDQVDLLLADARAAHLNALVVQVRRYGQTYYDSPFEPRADDSELAPGFDPLGYILQAARAGNPPLAVYAWLPALAVWDRDPGLAPPGHVVAEHPEWLTRDASGNRVSFGEYFLDPGHPGALSYTVALAQDLVSRYPLDGLLLDTLYYPYEESSVGYPIWGYNPTAVQRFRARYGGSGNPLPDDPLWMDWRREQLSALLRQLYLRCTELRPRLRIAVTAVAWGESPDQAGGWQQSSAYGRLLQDWLGWLSEGVLDLAAPMNYDREYRSDQRSWYDHWLSWQNGQATRRGLLVLQGAYLNYPEHTLAQAGRVPGNAIGFASYIPADLYADPEGNSLWVQPPRQPWTYAPQAEWWLWRALALPYGYVDPAYGVFTATLPIFPGHVPTPTLAWKDAPTLGHAFGWASGPGLTPLDGAAVVISGPTSQTLRSDGGGFFGAVDLPPGLYWAEVPGAEPAYSRTLALVEAGRVARFEPCQPLAGLTIQGPLALLAGQQGTYRAIPQPITASLPITFTWDNGTTGPTATYSWTATGTYTIALTASGPCGAGRQGTLSVRVLAEWPYAIYMPLVLP